jgi:hypothetical protein
LLKVWVFSFIALILSATEDSGIGQVAISTLGKWIIRRFKRILHQDGLTFGEGPGQPFSFAEAPKE